MNDNPHQTLEGVISVFESDSKQESSCFSDRSSVSPLGILHTALDLAGLIPVLGVIPDAINAGVYSIEGDWINAGISAAAMVPNSWSRSNGD